MLVKIAAIFYFSGTFRVVLFKLFWCYFIAKVICSKIEKCVEPNEFLEEYYPYSDRFKLLESLRENFVGRPCYDQIKLDSSWKYSEYDVRIQIISGKIFATAKILLSGDFRYRLNVLVKHLKSVVKIFCVEDVDFIVHMGDTFFLEMSDIASFKVSIDKNSPFEKDLLLFSDFYLIDKSWKDLSEKIVKARSLFSWKEKRNVSYWRGSSTGWQGSYGLSTLPRLPRLKLVMLSHMYPEYIDARFTTYSQFALNDDGNQLKLLLNRLNKNAGVNTEFIAPEDHLKFKYLLSLDGNTCAWKRPVWIMLSNSVLIKQETSLVEWFYAGISSPLIVL